MTRNLPGPAPRSVAERLMDSVQMCPVSGCWLCTNTGAHGYAHMHIGSRADGTSRTISAHRLAYETFVGPVGGMHVCHRCDVRCCVNPAHLFLGTAADNIRDMRTKGRGTRGQTHPNAKLTEQDVRDIKRRLTGGARYPALARQFGVSANLIGTIARCEGWAHLDLAAK